MNYNDFSSELLRDGDILPVGLALRNHWLKLMGHYHLE